MRKWMKVGFLFFWHLWSLGGSRWGSRCIEDCAVITVSRGFVGNEMQEPLSMTWIFWEVSKSSHMRVMMKEQPRRGARKWRLTVWTLYCSKSEFELQFHHLLILMCPKPTRMTNWWSKARLISPTVVDRTSHYRNCHSTWEGRDQRKTVQGTLALGLGEFKAVPASGGRE